MPQFGAVTKYRGRLGFTDYFFQADQQLSSIPGEQQISENGPPGPGEHQLLSPTQFADLHTGYAQLVVTIGGTSVVAGDVVACNLTPASGGSAVNVSYTATSGDAGQATVPLKLQAVATGLVNAINASTAVTGGSAFIQTVSAPSNAAFTIQAKNLGSVNLAINAATSATPGTAGHATISPNGATNPFVPQNPNFHQPAQDALIAIPMPGGQMSALIELTNGEGVLLDATTYNYAISQGVSFNF